MSKDWGLNPDIRHRDNTQDFKLKPPGYGQGGQSQPVQQPEPEPEPVPVRSSSSQKGSLDQSVVGLYDWEKGGSMEKYTQELELLSNGQCRYREFQETRTESWERVGKGSWGVNESDVVRVLFDELRKDNKMKSKVPIPGFQEEVKVDYNIAMEIKGDQLRKAPASGPSAPKNKWRKKQ